MDNKVTKDTIIRTIVFFVAMVNTVLTMFGKNPIPFSEDQIYVGLSAVAGVLASIWAWWKNNDFTPEARKAGAYLKELKAEKTKTE